MHQAVNRGQSSHRIVYSNGFTPGNEVETSLQCFFLGGNFVYPMIPSRCV
jgi:hypothetical protein